MLAHTWPALQHAAHGVAGWIDARMPSAVPRWVWAACTVVAALIVGRIGGRVLAGLMQLALLAAALLVAWQMVQTPGRTSVPAPVHGQLPRACALEGTCGSAVTAPASGTTSATVHA